MWAYSSLKKSRKENDGKKGGTEMKSLITGGGRKKMSKNLVDRIEKGRGLRWDEKTDVTWSDKERDIKYQ